MELDLTDLAFVAKVDSNIEGARITAIDLTGTLFKFLDGSKFAEFKQGGDEQATQRIKL